jgi:hypothetical protein
LLAQSVSSFGENVRSAPISPSAPAGPARLGGARSTPALAESLTWFGIGFGGIVMGNIADRIGVGWTVMFGAVMICVGLAISSLGAPWQLYVGHGLFIGFLGNGGDQRAACESLV